MAAVFMVGAAARRAARFKQVTKLLDSQIDQALVFVQTKGIDKPAVYDTTCLTLGRCIETAITSKAVPSPSHLPKLLLIVKEVYMRKAGLFDSSLLTLLIHIKSACEAGWYTDEDKDCLLIMVDKAILGNYNLDNQNDEPTSVDSVSEIISRYYPRMRVDEIITSFYVKAGEGKSVTGFCIAPNTVSHQNLWLLVARTDNMDTSACLTSPSNVDFLINDNRTRKKMGKGPQLPTNVTRLVNDGVNHLQLLGEFDGEYVIALAFMSLIPSPDSSRLQDYVRPISNDVESDCLVTAGRSRILLDCPFSGNRIRTPVKGHLCMHSQCFDYDFFMEANFTRPIWKCPVCKRPICNLDIRIDQTFLKILNEVADNVGAVYVSDDGSWTVSLTETSNKDAINQQNHVPDNTENLVPLESNEIPPVFSSAIGGSVIQCSTFEQLNITMAAVSLEANETPTMSSALHNTGGLVIECPSTTFEQPNVTTPPVVLEANETPPASSEQANVTTPAVDPPQIVKDSLLIPQSSCEVVHTPPPVQQTRPNPNPTATHLPTQTQSQNSQTQTDQPSNQDPRRSIRPRRTSVFAPVYLAPSSVASVLRKIERRPRNTTDEAQVVTPPINQRGLKRKTTGTEPQGTASVTPVIKKRGRPKKQVSATHVNPEVGPDEISYVVMKGGLTGKDREAAELEYRAAPRQPIYANKPWPEPTTEPVEQVMKQLNVSHPSDLPH